jgi:uncharacterized cupredoxin-like copper-binding protein
MKLSRCIGALLVVPLVFAACGGDDDHSASAKATSAKDTKPPVVAITATGSRDTWAFELPSGGITGGVVTLRLTNKSTSDTHDFQLARVDGQHTVDEVKALITSDDDSAPIPNWLHGAGGVASVAPGKSAETTLRLAPGHYFYFCNDDTNGTKHSQHGMFGELDVTGDSGASPPAATAHLDASEYKFTTDGLKAGANLVEFKNTGKELHMVLAAPLLPGKTVDDVKAAMASETPTGPPPMDFDKAVGAEVIDPGQSLFTTWNLAVGKYVLICFMTDHTGGPPHFVNGMIQELDIT